MKLGSVLLLVAVLLVGCSTTATLTPVEGPLANAGAPTIQAKIGGILAHSGTIEMTMPDGEICSGDWIAVKNGRNASIVSGVARGNRGTVLDFEMSADDNARAVGTATDNRGNRYRVLVKGI